MKTLLRALLLLALTCSSGSSAAQQAPAPGRSWRYELLAESGIVDDCPICGRPSIFIPLRGSFSLTATERAGEYRIENIEWFSDFSAEPQYRVSGLGTMTISGGLPPVAEFALIIKRIGADQEGVRFKNTAVDAPRIFPMLALGADEETQSLTRVYRLRVNAAPIRAMWFSTANGMTPSRGEVGGRISDGDLLSIDGSVFARHSELVQLLSVPPEDFGIDAVDIGPRGHFFFSLQRDAESAVNGTIGHGSLVSSEGRVILHNQQLLSAFNVVEQTDAGLDALHAMPNEEYYFSIVTPVTRASGGTLRRGDILSSQGRVVRTEQSLLARWQNPLPESVGVDAFHVWPNGEVWFSLQSGLNSSLGMVQPGDIISDQGYFVFRNLELVAPFAPLEDLADFGLDALSIVSDSNPAAGGPSLTIEITDEGVSLGWASTSGRIFQLQKAIDPAGPWVNLTSLTTATEFFEEGVAAGAAFYRVLQW